MQSIRRQVGMSMWSFTAVAVVAAFFILLFFKLLPPYLEFFKVQTSLENIASQPGAASMSKADLAAALDRRFTIEDISRVSGRKDLKVEKSTSGQTVLRIQYQVVVPIAYNVSALLDFNHGANAGVGRGE